MATTNQTSSIPVPIFTGENTITSMYILIGTKLCVWTNKLNFWTNEGPNCLICLELGLDYEN